ncbi:MAG TPA: hypothetical protein VHD90_25300 [Phototrophicaceae bacterium]|nr:hypothetical protein [Phototrophicaceae bacterium]
MTISNFRVKRPRPKKLSDPEYDFTPKLLKELLAVPDNQLEIRHYINLLGPYLPAGTYDESVYFLPGAFRYLVVLDDGGQAMSLVHAIIGFISMNQRYLQDDDILETVRDCVRECLEHWTKQFQIVHYDREASQKKGWGIPYFDYVKNTEIVAAAINDLVDFKAHVDLAEEFVKALADNTSDSVKAAWFLEYARTQFDPVRQPPPHKPITRLITDTERLRKAAKLVREHVNLTESSPTYWHDTFRRLHL